MYNFNNDTTILLRITYRCKSKTMERNIIAKKGQFCTVRDGKHRFDNKRSTHSQPYLYLKKGLYRHFHLVRHVNSIVIQRRLCLGGEMSLQPCYRCRCFSRKCTSCVLPNCQSYLSESYSIFGSQKNPMGVIARIRV